MEEQILEKEEGKEKIMVDDTAVLNDLSNAIVLQAVDDWRYLCERNVPVYSKYFAEIERFFRSTWAKMLCGTADPLYILRKLKAERENAYKKEDK